MENSHQVPAGSFSRTKRVIGFALLPLLVSSCSATPQLGNSLLIGEDVFEFCLDWKEDAGVSFGLLALETTGEELRDFEVNLVGSQNIRIKDISLVEQMPWDGAGSFGYKGSFEQNMSQWNDRRPPDGFVLEANQVWFVFIEAEHQDNASPMSATGVRVNYVDANGRPKYQISNIGFGMKGTSNETCFEKETETP